MILQQYKNQLDKQGVLLSYYGPMKQELVENFGELLRQQLAYQQKYVTDIPPKLSKQLSQTIFHIFIEQAQNIARYSAQYCYTDKQFNPDLKNGLFNIGKNDEFYFIECCNLIYLEHQEKIQQQLDHILTMNKGELKDYYRQRRRQAPPVGSKGAGLGFIDMARHSSKLEFEITSTDDNYAIFSLKIYI